MQLSTFRYLRNYKSISKFTLRMNSSSSDHTDIVANYNVINEKIDKAGNIIQYFL
jgi:hypothetical protein